MSNPYRAGDPGWLATELHLKCPACGLLPSYRYNEGWLGDGPVLSPLPAFYEWYCPACGWSDSAARSRPVEVRHDVG